MKTTSLFVKQKKDNQKFHLMKKITNYMFGEYMGFIVNKYNVVVGYNFSMRCYNTTGDKVNDDFKKSCGVSVKAFDKRIGDELFGVFPLDYEPLLYQLPVFKPVRGVRELTEQEKQYFYQIMIASIVGSNTVNPFGQLHDKYYPIFMGCGNDELLTSWFDFTCHNNLLKDEMKWRGGFIIDRELNQPKDIVIKGEKSYNELKRMSKEELTQYYRNGTFKDGECTGCDVRQIIGSGNCISGDEPYICRKEKQTTLEEWL